MVMAKTGDPLDELTASVAVVRAGSIRRKPIPKAKETTFFQLTMDVGERPVFVSAPGYYERARRVRFVSGVEPPLVRMMLDSKHTATFPAFENLSEPVQDILRRSVDRTPNDDGPPARKFLGLTQLRRAGLLNILAKLAAVPVDDPDGDSVLDHVNNVYEWHQDRLFLNLTEGSPLRDRIRTALGQGVSHFSEAEGALHKGFDGGSFKTKEDDKKGNLQLSFNDDDPNNLKVDADIDIYTDVLRHLFGEVFRNHLTGVKTDPFRVHGVLAEDDILPEYRLHAAAAEAQSA